MATKKTPVEKALDKKISQTKRKVKNKARKTHPAYFVIAFIFLILGFAASFYTMNALTKNDRFEIKGDKVTTVHIGDTLVYKDEGIRYVSVGRDLSRNVTVETNLTEGADGTYTVPTDDVGEYYIIYKASGGRCDGMTLYRVFRVS